MKNNNNKEEEIYNIGTLLEGPEGGAVKVRSSIKGYAEGSLFTHGRLRIRTDLRNPCNTAIKGLPEVGILRPSAYGTLIRRKKFKGR